MGLIENEGRQSMLTIEFQCKVTYLKKCEGIKKKSLQQRMKVDKVYRLLSFSAKLLT